MPNEIYHRSNWGNPKPEGWGDIYFDPSATNKLYNHSDNYENSDGTDKILRDIPNKASIVLTPTAYSDGSINTVIPPYAPSYIENIPFVTSEWSALTEGWSIDETNNKLVAEATWTGLNARANYNISEIQVGKTVRISFDAVVTAGEFSLARPYSTSSISTSGSYTFTDVATHGNLFRFLNKSTDFAGEITNIRVEVIEEADFDFSRGSSATRVNEKGLIEEVASDIPRIDYTDGTGSWLLEPQSTNFFERSNEFDDNYWQKINMTVTSNSAISPDGTNNAFLLDVGTGNNSHIFRKSNLPQTSIFTVSIFAKKGSTDYVWFTSGGASKGVQAMFDLSDGSVTDSGAYGSGQTLVAASSINMGNGWYRLILQGEATNTASASLTITPYYQATFVGGIDSSWQGNNENIYIYGAMNEENSYATSYIPTTSSSVTRAAETANNSGNADLFNDSEGVLYAEIAALADDGTFRHITMSDGSTANRIRISYTATSNQIVASVVDAGVMQANLTHSLTDSSNFVKSAIYYKTNDCAFWVNGFKINTDTVATMPSNLDTLNFDGGSGGASFYGKVKALAVFKEALTDQELQQLTS